MNIKQLAAEAGVSTATVSRVFSHHPNVKEEIRRRILDIARANRYHPRLSARHRNIVILTSYRELYPMPSYVEMVLAELTRELANRGFRIEIVPRENRNLLKQIPFCAAVGIGADLSSFPDWDETFGVPLVIVDRPIPRTQGEISSVRSDEEQAMDLAVSCFAEDGASRVGCIFYGRSGIGNTLIREAALRSALKKYGFPVSDKLIRYAGDGRYGAVIDDMLAEGVDALFCPGGNAGIEVSCRLAARGKKIPDEIALIASERAVFSRYAVPPQTTISQDYPLLARTVVEVIEARLHGESAPETVVLPYKLIRRSSTRNRKTAGKTPAAAG